MKVLRNGERVKFKINDVEFIVAPLSYRDRIALSAQIKIVAGETVASFVEQTFILIKKYLKGVNGLKDHEGNDYNLELNEDGELTDGCADELLNSFHSGVAVTALVQAARSDLTEIENVEFSVLGKS